METTGYRVKNLFGTPTDYADVNNWAHLPENADKDVDTFYVYPTVYINPAPDAPVVAPVDDLRLRAGVKNNYVQAPQVFEDLTNLYEPYYRQTNYTAYAGKTAQEVLALQLREQRTDLYAALDYFFANFNQGRPFILAGHSQGSMMLIIALRDYFLEHADYLKRMVAAYLIGFSVTKNDLAGNPLLKFAEGADDTGVLVSWNTEGPENKGEKNGVVLPGALVINPLTWTRDDRYAPASENLGDRLQIFDQTGFIVKDFQVNRPGLADAQLDLERGVVVCTTLPDRYIKFASPAIKNIFGPASLHLADYSAYWENIRENVRTRCKAYFAKEQG